MPGRSTARTFRLEASTVRLPEPLNSFFAIIFSATNLDRMRYGYRMDYDKGLSIVLEKNPHREVQGLACLALAQFLSDRLRMLRLVEDRPELAECYKIAYGKNYLPELQRLDRAKLASRIEALFERAADDYADVKFRAGTIGETAKSELYDIRYLSVGKLAPDIVGKDQDGKQFKLTDYRGKVVLLYFWSEF
ncbi:MAG: redoxin domain-containing protein [Planctomycetes bacterium]|nr:redoxin domain-containing protein [Planctomycetota bacterium]MBL7038944.1 redoxin domain-containing protein [Pirellulaceae bacterium]